MAFPTETVYGLGARLFDEKALRKVFAVKGRPADNPLIVHVGSPTDVSVLVKEVPPLAWRLMDRFWPGPLTLVFKKSARVPSLATAGLSTVAVRMPDHPVALKLIRSLGEPIAAPSANLSGRPSATAYAHAFRELRGRADMILAGPKARFGLESTVVDATRRPLRILRPGFVTLENLRKVDSSAVHASFKAGKGASPSPGLKHRHYKPSCEVVLVRPGEWPTMISKFKGRRLGILSFNRRPGPWKGIVFNRHFKGDRRGYARGLYSAFYEAEAKNVEVLLVESMGTRGLGRAIMDRLKRAAAG